MISSLYSTKKYSRHQFAVWRIFFGIYVLYYAIVILPYVLELFSKEGIYADSRFNTTFPSILSLSNSVEMVGVLSASFVVCAVMILIGLYRNYAAFIAWYIHACLFIQNPMTEDPSLAFVGILLVLLAIIPTGEPFSVDGYLRNKNNKKAEWYMPSYAYYTALLALGIGYTVSGFDKFLAEGWRTGDAIYHLMHLDIASDNYVTHLVQSLPYDWYKPLTWLSGGSMLFALPLLFWRATRPYIWLVLTAMFVFVTIVLDLKQVTLGMLIYHAFLIDLDWFPKRFKVVLVSKFLTLQHKIVDTYIQCK